MQNNVQTELNNSPLLQAIERYLVFMQAEENKSPLTVMNYKRSLALVAKLISVNDPISIDKMVVRDLKAKLASYNMRNGALLTISTRNHHLTVLRAFLRYLLQDEELEVYSPDRIKRFKEQEHQVKVLYKEDLNRLLASPDLETKMGKRDSAILHLFFSTGLRLSELSKLNIKDLNFDTREISVRGKRGKIRVVFLSDTSVDSLKNYINCRLDHLAPLFIRNIDNAVLEMPPGEIFRFSDNGIYKMVKKYALQAGIVSDPSPHTLRHSFATNLLQNGADLRSVQELLGHKDLSTTQIYTHVTNPQLKDVHEKFHGI